MPLADLLHLDLRGELKDKIETVLIDRCEAAVQGSDQRDRILQQWDDLLEGIPYTGYNRPRYKGAAQLNDPLTEEAFVSILATLYQAHRKDPKWQVEALDPEDENDAALQEQWLTHVSTELRLNAVLYHVDYNALRFPSAPLYVGWKQLLRDKRSVGYRHPDTDAILSEAERDPEVEYEEVPISQPNVVWEGADLRVVDYTDCYFYPADIRDPNQATAIFERLYLTEDDLLDGIDDYGYDKDAVQELIRRAANPTMSSGNGADTLKSYQDQHDGRQSVVVQPQDGYFECFLGFGKLPRIRDERGHSRIPAHLDTDEMLFVLCPAYRIVLKCEFSPYGRDRPYIFFQMLPRPNRTDGKCLTQMLESLQIAGNANLNLLVDSMNLIATPATKVKETVAKKYGKWSIFPGAQIPVESMDDIEPLEWDKSATDLIGLQNLFQGRAQQLVSGQTNALQQKVRKAAEVQAVQQAIASKLDLYLSNVQVTGMEPLAARLVSLYATFMPEEGDDFTNAEGRKQHISPDQLRGQFRYIPTATTQTATMEGRVEMARMKQQVQMTYFQSVAQAPPQFHPYLWHAARALLLDMNEPQPEQWIGPDPQQKPLVDPRQQMMQMLQQQQQGQGQGGGMQARPMNGANNGHGQAAGIAAGGMG